MGREMGRRPPPVLPTLTIVVAVLVVALAVGRSSGSTVNIKPRSSSSSSSSGQPSSSLSSTVIRCEPVKAGLCMGIGYNLTGMPNLHFAGSWRQSDAEAELDTYVPLIQMGCSPELQFFLCAAYVPMCLPLPASRADASSASSGSEAAAKSTLSGGVEDNINQQKGSMLATLQQQQQQPQRLIGPCRAVCERVRRGCGPTLAEFDLAWPEVLDCAKFPAENGHGHMCMEGPGGNGGGGVREGQGGLPGAAIESSLLPTAAGGFGGGGGDLFSSAGADGSGGSGGGGDRKKVNSGPSMSLPASSSSLNTFEANPLLLEKVKQQLAGPDFKLTDQYRKHKSYIQLLEANLNSRQQQPAQGINVQCSGLRRSSKYHFVKRTGECVPECGADISFGPEEKSLFSNWTLGLATTGAVLSLASFVTLAVDDQWGAWQNRCPRRPTVARFAFAAPPSFLALCSFFHCCGLLLGQALSSSSSSPTASTTAAATTGFCLTNDEDPDVRLVAVEGHRSQPCVVVFLLYYFFGMATSAWWTAASFAWCAAIRASSSAATTTSSKGSSDGSRRRQDPSTDSRRRTAGALTSGCHAFAWGVPAVLTLAALLTHNVEPAELSSVCYPGAARRDTSLLLFVLVPEGLQLLLATICYVTALFASAGGVGAWCCCCWWKAKAQSSTPPPEGVEEASRSAIMMIRGTPGKAASRTAYEEEILKKLLVRNGVFGVLYTLPKVCLIGTVAYEYLYRASWLDSSNQWSPNMEVFMLRTFMSVFVGIACLWWIAKKDVLASWSACSSACLGLWGQRPKDPLQQQQQLPNIYPKVAYIPQPQMDQNELRILSNVF